MELFARQIDRSVLEVISKLYDRESPYTILDTLIELEKSERNRLERVRMYLEEGDTLVEGLYKEKLISKSLYDFLKSAESNRNLSEFAKEKLKLDKSFGKVKKELIFSLISPGLAFLMTFFIMYIFLYKVIPNFNIKEKHLAFLPSYFPILLKISQNPIYFFMTLAFVAGFFVSLYLLRKKFPIISFIYLLTERVKLYAHLYLSAKVGFSLDEAFRKYQGALRGEIDRLISLMEEGEYLVEAFLKSMSKLHPIEKPLVVAGLKKGEVSDLKDLYNEAMEILITRLEVVKQLVSYIALIIVAGVILFAYGGILMPILRAMKSIAGG